MQGHKLFFSFFLYLPLTYRQMSNLPAAFSRPRQGQNTRHQTRHKKQDKDDGLWGKTCQKRVEQPRKGLLPFWLDTRLHEAEREKRDAGTREGQQGTSGSKQGAGKEQATMRRGKRV
jgi:hypothetical protein